jgi:hypothetical protein
MKLLVLAGLAALAPAVSAAQDPAPVYQQGQRYSFDLKADGFLRQEFTDSPITFVETDRALARLRPRVEIGINRVLIGVGGDFLYSSEKNLEFAPTLPLLRDNYDSVDARLDLAFVDVHPGALRATVGRFPMPVRLTEMVWDRDLRPQGASVGLEAHERGAFKRLGLTGLFARGSHVFPQDGVFDFSDRETLWMASGTAALGAGEQGTVELVASYLTWSDLDRIDPRLRRQNTRASAGGPLATDFDVVDLVARYQREGRVPLQLVADYAVNTGADDKNKGVWLAAVLGSVRSTPVAFEYTFARVDPDAVLAAFAADDFIWETGWEGHRGDFGVRIHDHWSAHAVGQRQRFKDAPREADRDLWLKRWRIELRMSY